MLFFLLIFIVFFIFFIPILFRSEKIGVNVYTIFLVVLFFQLIVRNILIAFDLPDETYVQSVLLRGLKLNEIILSPLIFFISSIFIVLSYMIFRAHKEFEKSSSTFFFLKRNPNEKKIFFWCILFFLISLISNLIFFSQFDLSLISFYRGATAEIEQYSAQGYLRLGVGLSIIPAFVGLAYFWQHKKTSLRNSFLTLSIFSFFLLTTGAFLSSSRAVILVAFIGILFLALMSDRKIKILRSISLLTLIFSLISFMTIYRTSEERNDLNLEAFKQFSDAPLYLIVNQGGIDVIKTQHLIDYVKEKNDYRYGELLSNIVLLSIPRSLWRDKPVNIDTQFGMSVYEADVYGAGAVPPGILGEFFWDFSWIGLIVASLISGMLMGLLDKILHKNRESIFIKVIFSASLIWTGMALLGSGFVSFFIGVMYLFVPMGIMFLLSNISFRKT